MKHLILIIAMLFSFVSLKAQTKILDSYVDWPTATLTVYLTGADASSLMVQIGTAYGSSDVFNASYTIGTDLSIADNLLNVPLSGVAQGNHFVKLTLTLPDSSVQEMEFKTQL